MSLSRKLTSYFVYARVSFRNYIRGRMRFALRLAACLFFCFVFIEIWRLVEREGFVDIPYRATDLYWYAGVAQMMLFISPRLFMVIEDDVRSGNIAYFLGRPLPYLLTRLAEGVGAMSAHAVVYFPVGTLVLYLYIGEWPSAPLALPVAFALVYGGSLLHLLFQMSTGMTAFWLHDSDTIYRVYQKGIILLGGVYLPLSLYPPLAQAIALYTPFPAMVYLPCSVLLTWDAQAIFQAISLLAIWIVFAALLMFAVFAFCIRRIEINGG